MRSFYYVSNGKMFFHENGQEKPIRSEVLDSYMYKLKDGASRNEWKRSGQGAEFLGSYDPQASAEEKISSVRSHVYCMKKYGEQLFYSISIDGVTGIYRKSPKVDKEGIVISSSDVAYRDFDIKGDKLVYTCEFAGERHIGILDIDTPNNRTYTEGRTVDSRPVWSKTSDAVYFVSSGLLLDDGEYEREETKSFAQGAAEMLANGVSADDGERSPEVICRLDFSDGSISELLSDERYDHTSPQATEKGELYYIRRPHITENGSSFLGCLGDIVLFPFRMLRALFGFFNLFSAKYSGKTLSRGGVKKKSERDMIVDGNIINAQRELEQNRKGGDKTPGFIPKTWELRRISPSGEDSAVRKGVCAYRVNEDGSVLVSNGSYVIELDENGNEISSFKAHNVTYIM